MVSAAEMLTILECLGNFFWEYIGHAPTLRCTRRWRLCEPSCWTTSTTPSTRWKTLAALGPLTTRKSCFWSELGVAPDTRAASQPVDLWLLQALGYLPQDAYRAMALPATRARTARSSQVYPTAQGHLEVQEVEARGRFRGRHYAYWRLQHLTLYQGDSPSESSESWSQSDTESSGSFV